MRTKTYCTILFFLSSLSLTVCTHCHAAALPAAGFAEDDRQFSCMIHAHSKLSGEGVYTLPEMTDVAGKYGIDAIFLTDNLTYTLTYGLPPLRHILWASHSKGSVLKYGAGRYLEGVEGENKRQSGVLYIPGVEICPRYFWTGSIIDTNLVCHDNQRNLMALGIYDKDVISAIPEACGFVWQKNALLIIVTRTLLALFVIACLSYKFLPRILSEKSGYGVSTMRRAFLSGIILPLLLIMIVTNLLLSLVPSLQIYGRGEKLKHEKRVLEFLSKNNIVSYWAHPEAFDRQDFSRYRFRARTEPYPHILAVTSGYTGFGGVYEDKNTMIEPGAEWDHALMGFLDGKGLAPPWCFGEMLYHYEGQAGKKMGNIHTVICAADRMPQSLLDSLRMGRFYARRNDGDHRLILNKWMISGGDKSPEISATLSAATPGVKINVKLVCNGRVIKEWADSATPLQLRYQVRDAGGDSRLYFRLLADGPGTSGLASNPLFISR